VDGLLGGCVCVCVCVFYLAFNTTTSDDFSSFHTSNGLFFYFV
jgi:hypothetical protein